MSDPKSPDRTSLPAVPLRWNGACRPKVESDGTGFVTDIRIAEGGVGQPTRPRAQVGRGEGLQVQVEPLSSGDDATRPSGRIPLK